MSITEKPYLRRIEKLPIKDDFIKEYPFNIPLIKNLKHIDFHPDVTFFVGENGVGKSTVIESIAVSMGYNAEGGNKNVNFSTKDTTSPLSKYIKAIKSYKKPKDGYFLRAESLYNVASYMDTIAPEEYQGYGGKSLHSRSHGEAFLSVLMDKLKGNGLYILDEPEAALSPSKLIKTLKIIDNLVKAKSQFIISTHSPILLAYPNAKILEFTEYGIEEVKYTETSNYSLTRRFLNNYEEELKRILGN